VRPVEIVFSQREMLTSPIGAGVNITIHLMIGIVVEDDIEVSFDVSRKKISLAVSIAQEFCFRRITRRSSNIKQLAMR
jgi:hypothetical protein